MTRLPLVAFLSAVSALLLTSTTGCGMLSAVANPKVAWAIQDPAPMSVVVRRAEVAATTSVEVDRLLTATPASPNSEWLRKVAPSPKDAAAEMKALSQEPMYKKSHARVVAAEVWARTLAAVHGTGGTRPSLLSAIDQGIGADYAEIAAKQAEVEAFAKHADDEKAAADAKDAAPEAKQGHLDAAAKLAKQKSDAEDAVSPLKRTFLASLRERSAKVPDDQKAKFAPAIANLLQALDDADIANGAAVARYPLALSSLPDSITEVVPVLAADVVEEKTGKRPPLANLKPSVSLHGTDVEVTLAGLTPADRGSLSIADLTKEVVSRSGKWVLYAMTLLGTVNATGETLSFQREVLTDILAGLGPVRAPATRIPCAESPEVVAAAPATHLAAARRHDVRKPAVAKTSAKESGRTPPAKGASSSARPLGSAS